MRKLYLAILLSLLTMTIQAQNITVKLWDNQTAPHSNNLTGPEKDEGGGRVSNTTEATLYIYEAPADKATGQAIVICPGGGYRLLAMSHEGFEFSEWFAKNGITVAVLKYRMPNGVVQVPMEDAARALQYMREEWRGRASLKSLGIMGFSAGGHLAATTGVGALAANGDNSPHAQCKADFMVLFYPVISSNLQFSHSGSYNNLLGKERSEELSQRWSPERFINEQTPPTILLLSDDDKSVNPVNSTLFYNTLKSYNRPASMLIMPEGGHGWGFRESFSCKPLWQATLLKWLQELQKLQK